MNSKYPYQKEWDVYLKLDSNYTKIRLLAPLPFFVFIILAGTFRIWFFETYLPFVLLGFFITLIIISLNISSQIKEWKCPKCLRNDQNNHFVLFLTTEKGKCKNCGLEKWEGSNIQEGNRF